jgi:hypothetical protein
VGPITNRPANAMVISSRGPRPKREEREVVCRGVWVMDDGRSDGLECICRLGMVDNNGDWGAMNDDAI